MIGLRPKQMARLGEFHLEEAILDVLLEARHEGQCLGAAEISKRAGIFRDPGPKINMNDAIVHGLANKLGIAGKVERCKQANGRGGWRLSDKEFERRRDDIQE